MQPGTRHTSAWGFRRISAPTAEHRVRILVAVVGLDVQKLADCSRLHRALERLHRRPPSAVMSHSKHDVRTPAGIDHPGSVGRLERKWLFAEYRLAGARCGDDLIEVQGMWRCQNDRPHFGVGERIRVVRAKRKVVLGGKITRGVYRNIHRADKTQALVAALHRGDEAPPPPAQSDDCGRDHMHTGAFASIGISSLFRLDA